MAKRSPPSSDAISGKGREGPGARSTSTRRPRERPGGPGLSGSIRADELLTLRELKARLGWGEHAVRQARRAGLRLIPFGREKFALGSDVLAFFTRLAEQHSNSNGQTQEGEG